MATGPFLPALAAIVCLLLSAPSWGAEKVPSSSPAVGQPAAGGLAKARAMVLQGRFDEALAILRPLARRREFAPSVLLQLGMAAVGASQKPGVGEEKRDALLDEAIAAFRAMLVRRPDLVRGRLELARAFFLKGEDTLGRRHFEQVLAGKPPAPVVLNVNRFLAEMRARKRWSVHVGVALAPDSNIGAGSDERIIHIRGLPFRRDRDDLTTSGVGISAWAGGEYQYPLGDRWRLRAGGGISRREYSKNEFDQMTVSGHVGPRWLAGEYTEASLLASVRQHWLANEPYHRDVGLRVEGRRRLGRRTTVNAQASRHERRYEDRTHLDGPVTDVSVGASWVATPTVRTDASVGWGRVRTELKRERNASRWVQAGVTVALPWGFTVGGSGTLRWTDYEGDWFPFTTGGESRSDLIRSLRLSAHNRAFTFAGFSPQVSLVHEERTTNAQLHEYQRTFGELRIVRLF